MGKSGDLILMSSFIQQGKMKSKCGNFKGEYGGIKIIFTNDQIMFLCIYPHVPYPNPMNFKNTYWSTTVLSEKRRMSVWYLVSILSFDY